MRRYIAGLVAAMAILGVIIGLRSPWGLKSLTTGQPEQNPFVLNSVDVRSDNDPADVIEVYSGTATEPGNPLGELRWDAVLYSVILKNAGNSQLAISSVKIIPSEAIVQLFDMDPFNDDEAGLRSNYGDLSYSEITVDPGEDFVVQRSIVAHANETDHASNLESPLTAGEHEQFKQLATDSVFLEVRWDGGSQLIPLEGQ